MDNLQGMVAVAVAIAAGLVAFHKAWIAEREGRKHRDECIAFARASRGEVSEELSRLVDAKIDSLAMTLRVELQEIIRAEVQVLVKHLPPFPRQG